MSYRARPPSPSNTNFSGISNYRSESYRPIREREVPAVPQIDSKKIARVHFDELQSFLTSSLGRELPNTRASAREKLTRLTRQQFQELSTDVYDELIRRNSRSDSPHLPNRDDFHPKRNQARQKLSTLPPARFKDLASDVYFELGRRYPEFKEPELLPDTPESAYEEFPANSRGPAQPPGRPSQETYRTRSPDNYNQPSRLGQAGGASSRGPERRPTPEQQYGRRSEENRAFGRQPSQASRADDAESMYSGPRRRPSNDPDNQFARKQLDAIPPGPSSATSGVVIPNKSTIAEEEIQVPYGRDSSTRESNIRDSIVTDGSGNDNITRGVSKGMTASGLDALGSSGPPAWDKSPMTPLQGGLNALAAGFNKQNDSALDDDDDDLRMFETSTVGGRARSASGSSNATRKVPETRGGLDREETEKMRRDYEYRITSLQAKVAALQDEVDKAAKIKKDDDERIRELTGEISSTRNKQSEQATALREAERRLTDEQDARTKSDQQTWQSHQQELRKLQQKHDDLQKEKNNMQSLGDSEAIIDDLKGGMEALLEEVKELAGQNEELSNSKDADLAAIQDLEDQVADYRKKYERAKTELRGLKATSQLFLQKPKTAEDQLPTSRTGAIQDVHITAFQSASDSLLSAGRSDAPSRVLVPVKAVVDAVSAIVEDARSYDLRQRSEQDLPVDYAYVENLCDRAEATLSNLVTASKTHATSYGLSPVSLLDAALSHVSASVTELAKLLLIRRSPRDGENGMTNGLSNGKYSNEPSYGREAVNSPIDMRSRGNAYGQSGVLSTSPPVISDEPMGSRRRGAAGDASSPLSAGRKDWSELKPYLDAQSEQLVSAIQGVLTAVRNPSPSLELNENVTQVITIVSSIVAVCRDSLPMSAQERGQTILTTLTDHCDRLSEVQSERNVTKESRQVMAQSSFAIASVVKELMKL